MSANTLGEVLLWLIVIAVGIVIAVYVLRWLYRRSTKETAFVRTGFLGEKVVVNGGAFVIPVLHEITPVNMNVMRIEVTRRGNGALITRNRMRVDILAEFFVRVRASGEAVAAAAQTLGRRTLQEDGIRSLMEGKFASAMRMVAAQMTLEEMHEQRRDYANQVRDLASEALAANGLELENVAIVDLDQTSLEYFDPSNAFDAEGLTQLTESIETRRKMRNEIEQRTLVDIRNQNLEAQKKVFEIDRETEYARLEQEREVEFRRAVQRAELIKERALTPAEVWDEYRLLSAKSLYNFAGMTRDRLRKEHGLLWPCPTEDHPGTPRRYVEGSDPFVKPGQGWTSTATRTAARSSTSALMSPAPRRRPTSSPAADDRPRAGAVAHRDDDRPHRGPGEGERDRGRRAKRARRVRPAR